MNETSMVNYNYIVITKVFECPPCGKDCPLYDWTEEAQDDQ